MYSHWTKVSVQHVQWRTVTKFTLFFTITLSKTLANAVPAHVKDRINIYILGDEPVNERTDKGTKRQGSV